MLGVLAIFGKENPEKDEARRARSMIAMRRLARRPRESSAVAFTNPAYISLCVLAGIIGYQLGYANGQLFRDG